MPAAPELLPYHHALDEVVTDLRIGMFQPVSAPMPLAAPYVQMLISVAATQPALKSFGVHHWNRFLSQPDGKAAHCIQCSAHDWCWLRHLSELL